MSTGQKSFYLKKIPNPVGWVLFLLEQIGRTTYKSIFFLIKLVFIFILAGAGLAILISKLVEFIFNSFLNCLKNIKAELKFKNWLFLEHRKKKLLFKIKPKRRGVKMPKISLPAFFLPRWPLFGAAICILILFGFYLWILKDLPSPNKLATKHQPVSTKIYDRQGRLMYTLYNGDENRSLITLDKVPQDLINATIAIEDQDFFHHQGFSVRGIVRAIDRNIFKHKVEGGSTITQQLVKNVLLTPEKTITRKIKELVLSIEVELMFNKEEILQMYFNQIPYGGTSYGVAAAAKTYFDKDVKDLTLAEAALLAGLPAAPTQYSPFGANPKMAFLRQSEVLKEMVDCGFISPEEAQKALEEKITFAAQRTDIKAPHFVMYVKDLLTKKYGRRLIEEGGLEVITSLDLDIQEMAEKEVNKELDKLAGYHVTNGAVLITKPKTGEILAMVGSRDYFDAEVDGNVNLTTSLRQPGSAIKVVNYAMALQLGYKPSSIISDTPVAYQTAGSPVYTPVNYDNRFHGNVTLRTALASSYNIPAVKLLASYGVDKMIYLGQLMGITTWNDPSRYGLSITLGGAEVKMTDLAVVYGTLSNYGKRVDLNPILKIIDFKGRVLENNSCFGYSILTAQAAEETQCQGQQILNPGIAYLLSDILSDNNARTPAFGPNSALVIPGQQVAVKTGTSNDKKDNWTIGYTTDYLVAVWVGNNDNTPMSAIASGVTGASPIWNQIMTNLLKDKPVHRFQPPEEIIAIQICSLNGLLPCEGCPTKTEYFLKGNEPTMHCNPEEMKKIIENQKKEEEEKDKILQGATTQSN
jgi:1A family penicillin-binding protein